MQGQTKRNKWEQGFRNVGEKEKGRRRGTGKKQEWKKAIQEIKTRKMRMLFLHEYLGGGLKKMHFWTCCSVGHKYLCGMSQLSTKMFVDINLGYLIVS